jgi:hypothetical protein
MSKLPPDQHLEVAEQYAAKLVRIIERYVEPDNAYYNAAFDAVERFTIDMTEKELREALAAALRIIRPINQL